MRVPRFPLENKELFLFFHFNMKYTISFSESNLNCQTLRFESSPNIKLKTVVKTKNNVKGKLFQD